MQNRSLVLNLNNCCIIIAKTKLELRSITISNNRISYNGLEYPALQLSISLKITDHYDTQPVAAGTFLLDFFSAQMLR